MAYDRQSGTTTNVTNDDGALLNQSPAISPDGKIIVWEHCANIVSPCSTWKGMLSNGTWTATQLISPADGNQSHPDTDGTIIAYSSNITPTGNQLLWQPVAGGTEQELSLQGGNASVPSTCGGPGHPLIAFSYLPPRGTSHDLAVYDVAANVLYDVTKDVLPSNPADKELSDISVTPDGKVRVVWHQQDPANLSIYAYPFNLPSTTSSLSNLIGSLVQNGCIDNSGIGNALLSKLSAAQAAITSGNVQTAVNILTALKSQIQAQAGKHISTSCTMNGSTFNPVTVLLDDVQGLIDSLRVSLIPNPITGEVVDANGAAVPGATVVISDANGNTVANTTTDITGFYFFATTGVLSSGGNYTIGVSGHPSTTRSFSWGGSEMTFDFAVN